MQTPQAKWYFDFISPFAYFHLKLLKSRSLPLDLEPVPILFAGLLKAWGTKGPAELPSKRLFTYRHCNWLASHYGIPFRFPPAHPFNPLRALRIAIAAGPTVQNVEKIFNVIFNEGHEPDSASGWQRIQDELGITDAEALVSDTSVKNALSQNTGAAVARGVFGVPTVDINGELFWGSDSVPMMEAYLKDPGLFRSPEMRRVSELPIGAARRT